MKPSFLPCKSFPRPLNCLLLLQVAFAFGANLPPIMLSIPRHRNALIVQDVRVSVCRFLVAKHYFAQIELIWFAFRHFKLSQQKVFCLQKRLACVLNIIGRCQKKQIKHHLGIGVSDRGRILTYAWYHLILAK